MKVLYIAPTFIGGIGGHAKRVSEKLNKHGFDIELFNVPHIPIKNLKNPSFAFFGTINALIQRKKYDVVHAWNIPSGFVMKRISAKKKILSVHGVYGEQLEIMHSKFTSKLGIFAESEAFKIADVLTTDSKFVQKTYKKKFGIDFVYLPAPLDLEKFKKIENNLQTKNQIVYVGRDSYEKGIDILKNIESKISANVVYCTNTPWEQTMKILKESKILIVPSRMESIPQVIKEAFFLKIPVIATNVGGIPEIIENGKTGILIPPENQEKTLSSINNLLKNKILSKRLSENAYNFINENFSWKTLLPNYINLYKNSFN